MNIRDLEYLVALAEHRHFRRAADSCHVSQPTLSGQIRKLEDELGVMLLERTSRKVLFTQAGMLLVDQARTVLREVKVLKEMASQQGACCICQQKPHEALPCKFRDVPLAPTYRNCRTPLAPPA